MSHSWKGRELPLKNSSFRSKRSFEAWHKYQVAFVQVECMVVDEATEHEVAAADDAFIAGLQVGEIQADRCFVTGCLIKYMGGSGYIEQVYQWGDDKNLP